MGFHGVGGGRFSDAAHWVAARPCPISIYQICELAFVQNFALFFMRWNRRNI
jgi:hypothetical protein